jgi:hypothetical protein
MHTSSKSLHADLCRTALKNIIAGPWPTLVKWDGDVDPAIKDRLELFLNLAKARFASLVERLDDMTDPDRMAALSAYVQPLAAALASAAAEDTARAIHEWAIETADETAVRTCQRTIAWTLEDETPPVSFVTAAVLLARICRAVVASHPELAAESVLAAAADRLEQHTQSVLEGVLTGRISARRISTRTDRVM